MANYFNIFAGMLTFLVSSVLGYIFWTPVMAFMDYFPTELFIMTGAMWVMVLFTGIVYMPIIMLISDDKG